MRILGCKGLGYFYMCFCRDQTNVTWKCVTKNYRKCVDSIHMYLAAGLNCEIIGEPKNHTEKALQIHFHLNVHGR